jgi:hypothetical protein
MSKARELAELGAVYDSGALSNRNLVINGGMEVAQRATSVSSQTASAYQTVDRMYTNASGATYNQSQQTVTVGGETGLPNQFSKYLRFEVTTGNNYAQIYHKIEDVTSVPAGTVTLSFYAKGTTPDSGLTFLAWQNFGTGGSPSTEVVTTISQTVTLTSTWQRFTVNITVPSISGKTLGTNGNSTFYFGIGQGGSTSTDAWTLDITGLQLEVGTEATPFEHRSFGDELARCQRYYWVYTSPTLRSMNRYSDASGTAYEEILHPVKMRANPSFSQSGTWTASSGYAGIPTCPFLTQTYGTLASANSVAAGGSVYVQGGTMAWDAEL